MRIWKRQSRHLKSHKEEQLITNRQKSRSSTITTTMYRPAHIAREKSYCITNTAWQFRRYATPPPHTSSAYGVGFLVPTYDSAQEIAWPFQVCYSALRTDCYIPACFRTQLITVRTGSTYSYVPCHMNVLLYLGATVRFSRRRRLLTPEKSSLRSHIYARACAHVQAE